MPFEVAAGLPAELVPLSWLIGRWRGTGAVEFPGEGSQKLTVVPFEQEVEFRHYDRPWLEYRSTITIDGEHDRARVAGVLSNETGYWRLARQHLDTDHGPALMPGTAPRGFVTADDVEALRGEDGYPIEVTLAHPTGVGELYIGAIADARINLTTDALFRTVGAASYRGATRMYGLVRGELMWAWDIATGDRPLANHASGRLTRLAEPGHAE